jgi:hypothetical protein
VMDGDHHPRILIVDLAELGKDLVVLQQLEEKFRHASSTGGEFWGTERELSREFSRTFPEN